MITPRIKPSSFYPEEAADGLFVVQQRKAKLEGYVQGNISCGAAGGQRSAATRVSNQR